MDKVHLAAPPKSEKDARRARLATEMPGLVTLCDGNIGDALMERALTMIRHNELASGGGLLS